MQVHFWKDDNGGQHPDAARKLDWHIARASAKSGDRVDEAFAKLAELMVEVRKASA